MGFHLKDYQTNKKALQTKDKTNPAKSGPKTTQFLDKKEFKKEKKKLRREQSKKKSKENSFALLATFENNATKVISEKKMKKT